MNSLADADYAIIIGFFVVLLATGLYFSGRMRSAGDYFSGGRRVPWWLSGTSFYMSSFSSFTFVAYSAIAYEHGWVAVTLYWVSVPAALVSAWFFAARWRRAATTTPLEYVEERYGIGMRQSLAWLGIPMKLIDDGLKLFAIGTLVTAGLGIEQQLGVDREHALAIAVLATGSIMLVYTLLGGLWAVLITDFVQFVVLIAAIVVLVPLALAAVDGFEGFVANAPEGFFRPTSDDHGVVYLLVFFLLITMSFSSQWQLVQRYYSVESDRDARKVGYLVAVLNIVTPPLFFLPAMAARQFLPAISQSNEVYGLLCRELLPVGMVGLLIAAMFSATMSMLSSDYNAIAAVLTNDVYKRLLAPRASERSLVTVGRSMTLVVGLVAMGVAVLILRSSGEKSLFDMMVALYGIFLPPIAVPMLAGLITRRPSNLGGLCALLGGVGVGIAAFLIRSSWPERALGELLARTEVMTALTTATALVGLGLGTSLDRGSPAARERIARFFARLEAPEAPQRRELEDRSTDVSPAPIVGLFVAALGALLFAAVLVTGRAAEAWLSLAVGAAMLVAGGATAIVTRQRAKETRP